MADKKKGGSSKGPLFIGMVAGAILTVGIPFVSQIKPPSTEKAPSIATLVQLVPVEPTPTPGVRTELHLLAPIYTDTELHAMDLSGCVLSRYPCPYPTQGELEPGTRIEMFQRRVTAGDSWTFVKVTGSTKQGWLPTRKI